MALVAVSLVLYAVDGHVVMALIAAATLAVMAVVLRRMDRSSRLEDREIQEILESYDRAAERRARDDAE
jgi:predicted proteasome-type protease